MLYGIKLKYWHGQCENVWCRNYNNEIISGTHAQMEKDIKLWRELNPNGLYEIEPLEIEPFKSLIVEDNPLIKWLIKS